MQVPNMAAAMMLILRYATAKKPKKKKGMSLLFPIVMMMMAKPIAGKIPPATLKPPITHEGSASIAQVTALAPNKFIMNTGMKRRTKAKIAGYVNAQ